MLAICLFATHSSHLWTLRLASRKFMNKALEFARLAKEQMGVEIFMLAGWQDEKGQIKKAK